MENYWQNLLSRSHKETQLLQPWRVYSSIGGTILGVASQQWRAQQRITLSTVAVSTLFAVGLYALLTAGEFSFRALFITPAKMWRDQQVRSEDLETAFTKLTDRDWPVALKSETRVTILGKLAGVRTFSIYHDSSSNCTDFARLLWDILIGAGWRNEKQVRPEPRRSVAVGVTIVTRIGNNPAQLASALADVLKIEAKVEIQDVPEVQIQIGAKRLATM